MNEEVEVERVAEALELEDEQFALRPKEVKGVLYVVAEPQKEEGAAPEPKAEWGTGRYYSLDLALDGADALPLRPGMSVRVDAEVAIGAAPAAVQPLVPAIQAQGNKAALQKHIGVQPRAVIHQYVQATADDGHRKIPERLAGRQPHAGKPREYGHPLQGAASGGGRPKIVQRL